MDTINEIIKELDKRGLVYLRIYNSDRVKGQHGRGWITKCVRQRPDGSNVTVEAESFGEPVDAYRALLEKVDGETESYLNHIANEAVSA